MTEGDALHLIQTAAWSIVVASGPAVGAAMLIGVAIAFLQALTQVQEMTLTFVPKILGVLAAIAVSAPFMGAQLQVLTELLIGRVESGF